MEFTAAITATTTIPIITAIFPFAVGPSPEDASPKLWAKSSTCHQTENGHSGVCISLSCQDQLTQRTAAKKNTSKACQIHSPSAFHSPSVCAIGIVLQIPD